LFWPRAFCNLDEQWIQPEEYGNNGCGYGGDTNTGITPIKTPSVTVRAAFWDPILLISLIIIFQWFL
jgi:hypothetical protein